VIGHLSEALRGNLGEVLALLPLPVTEVNVESVEHTASGYLAILELVGAAERIRVGTRWKDRDGVPTIVEVSHLSRTAQPEAEDLDESSGTTAAADGSGTPGSTT
jgi:hypothetical protein